MLVRRDDRGALLIGQPSHAWISGQLARAWGNDVFGRIEPREEVCLAAEQHDIGMAEWDIQPERNPDTGFPRSFMEMPIQVHLGLWTAGPRRLLRQSRYAALLTSMHGTRLYRLRDLDRLPPQEAGAIRDYLAAEEQFQNQLRESLGADPATADAVAPHNLERNSQLIWTWDSLSLALCLDWAPWTATSVPTADGTTDLNVISGEAENELLLDPWPLNAPTTVHCEGQRLHAPTSTDDVLAEALGAARWERLELNLRPRSEAAPG
jgi:Protein of unknown function (DUF3891)